MVARSTRTHGSSSVATVVALLVVVTGAALAYGSGMFNHAYYVFSGIEERGQEAIDVSLEARLTGELADCYAYSQLDEDDRRRYRIMYETFATRRELYYPVSDEDNLSHIRESVLADHPEFFYVMGVRTVTTTNSISNLTTGVIVRGDYSFDEEQTEEYRAVIDDAVEDFLDEVPKDADDYEKSKTAYRYLVEETDYDLSLVDEDADTVSFGQTIKDVFVDKRAVCAGYAAAYQYLLEQMGLESVSIAGFANDESHAWCVAWLDGEPYHVDPTWGDPVFLDDENAEGASDYVNYDYLDVTTADIEATHEIDSTFPVPECESDADNYYVREDLYFDWADADRLGELVAECAFAGGPPVQIRCADEGVFRELLDNVIASGVLRDYISGMGYRYSSSDSLFTIAVFPDESV